MKPKRWKVNKVVFFSWWQPDRAWFLTPTIVFVKWTIELIWLKWVGAISFHK